MKTSEEKEMNNPNDNSTYLDKLYQYLQNKNVLKADIQKLNAFVTEEEYDSITVEMLPKQSKITKALNK